jgi:hypothetical protein
VDTDADTRLARRVRRDIVERGRDVLQVPLLSFYGVCASVTEDISLSMDGRYY